VPLWFKAFVRFCTLPCGTVEISGYSHFFGFEALIRPHRDGGQVYEYLRKRPKRDVGMPFAKTALDEVSF